MSPSIKRWLLTPYTNFKRRKNFIKHYVRPAISIVLRRNEMHKNFIEFERVGNKEAALEYKHKEEMLSWVLGELE